MATELDTQQLPNFQSQGTVVTTPVERVVGGSFDQGTTVYICSCRALFRSSSSHPGVAASGSERSLHTDHGNFYTFPSGS